MIRALIGALLFLPLSSQAEKPTVTVACKAFTEGYVLAEIIAQTIENAGEAKVERKFGMGGTAFVFNALLSDEIDVIPDYTGTISLAMLKDSSIKTIPDLREKLKEKNLIMTNSLGFNNTYAVAVTNQFAEPNGLSQLSDLKKTPDIRITIGHEFLKREDGYHGLVDHYDLEFNDVKGVEYGLQWESIEHNKGDLIVTSTTDAKLKKYDVRVLKDDKKYFPEYFGIFLARKEFATKFPKSWLALRKLEGNMSEEIMIELNAMADIEKKSIPEVAASFLKTDRTPEKSQFWQTMIDLGKEHLILVILSLLAAIAVGVPMGVIAAYSKTLGQPVLILSGLLQTIPSIALLCFMIPLFGIGAFPALVALFLYSLLPIVRGTYSGLISQDPKLLEVGRALGLSFWQRLRLIETPMASIHIMSGIKTSAIINVGTATLAALIGAGGYGTLIMTGLALNNHQTVLEGAVPAAILALLMHGFFEILDRVFIPKGLRINPTS